ncbi:MAG: hypothetical protein PHP62_02165 [Candidatus Moranbacteria bacterium]|nr:hypothetical protein [Candidatus Moranbacteria bacterium]
MKRKQSNSNFITYEHFAKTYLLMARISLLAIDGSIDKKKLNPDDNWRLESGLILIPIIYCIRHSIELFLKSIDIGNTISYLKTHDNKELSKVLLSIKAPLADFKKIKKIINKYTSYCFSKELIENVSKKQSIKTFDSMNELFRYPDNDINLAICGKNLHLLKSSEVLQDIEDIKLIFGRYSSIRQLTKKTPNVK